MDMSVFKRSRSSSKFELDDENQKAESNDQLGEPGAKKVKMVEQGLARQSCPLETETESSSNAGKSGVDGEQCIFPFDAKQPSAVMPKISGHQPINMEFNVQNVIAEPGAHVVIGPTIIDDTNASTLQNEIDCLEHFREDSRTLFVCTDAFIESEAVLDKYYLLVVTGAPGMGKTFNSQQLLLKLCDEKHCKPFQPNVPEQYLQWCNTRERQAFLMDDVFGASSFNQAKYDAWINVFPKMIQHLKSLNTYLLFACRENILKSRLTALKTTGIFNNIINLSDEKFQLTAMNKTDMYLFHTNKFNINIKYGELEDDQSTGMGPIGFPQRVHLFCSMVNVRKEVRMRYFNCPMEYLSTLIGSYRETDHDAYCVLILLLLHDGQLPVSFLNHSNKSSELVQRCLDICDIPTSTMGALRNKADSLCNSLLLLANDIYVYQHPSVMEAVTLDFGQRYPSEILNSCSVDFLLERVFTQNSATQENEYVVILQPAMFPQLCERLVKEMTRCLNDQKNSMRSLSSYAVFRDDEFNLLFLCQLQDTDSLHLLLTSSQSDSQQTTFLFFAAASGQDAIIQKVFSSYLCDVQRLPGFLDHVDHIIYAVCNSGMTMVARALLAVGTQVDYRTAHAPDDVRRGRLSGSRTCTTLMHAAYSGSVDVLQLVIDHLQQQRVDVVEHVGIRDRMGRTALHWGALGGRGAAVLQKLLEVGADINVTDKAGQTTLYLSAQHGDEESVRALVDAGADVHIRCIDKSPLVAAAFLKQTAVIDFLISRIASDDLEHWLVQFLLNHFFIKDSASSEDNDTEVFLPEKFPQLCGQLMKEIHRFVCIGDYEWPDEACASYDENDSSINEGEQSSLNRDASYGGGDPRSLRALSTYRVFQYSDFLHIFLNHLHQTDSFSLLLTSSSSDSLHPTFLFLAAASGQDVLVHEVLSSQLGDMQRLPRFRDHLDRILYAACYCGSLLAVRALLEAGARADFRMAHCPEQVRYGFWYGPKTCTTLMHAAFSGNIDVLQLIIDDLLNQRLDVAEHVNIRDGWGNTVLHWMAHGRQRGAALQILLGVGAHVNARNAKGQTALHLSIYHDEPSLRVQLKAGADVHMEDDMGRTALHRAVDCMDYTSVQLLVEAGADVNATDNEGQTVLYRAVKCVFANIVRHLVDAGADVNARDDESRTERHCAVVDIHESIVRLLVELGAEVHLRASSSSKFKPYTDKSPLEIAVLRGHTVVADFIRNRPSKYAAHWRHKHIFTKD